MNENYSKVQESVRHFYAELARSGTSCCSMSEAQQAAAIACCDGKNMLYPEELLRALPDEVATFSLGCGDPISLADMQSGEVVLDLGSGGGLDCFLAARKVGKDGRVIGVDMTPEMLTRAQEGAARLGLSNVEFLQGVLEDLPIEDSSIDVVISNCVINLSPDKARGFREIWRVLKPGGRLAIADIVINGALPEELRNDMHAWESCIGGALEVSEYVMRLVEAGFTEITIQPHGGAVQLFEHQLPRGKLFSASIYAIKPEQNA